MAKMVKEAGWIPQYSTVKRDLERRRREERQALKKEMPPTEKQMPATKKPRLVPPPPKASPPAPSSSSQLVAEPAPAPSTSTEPAHAPSKLAADQDQVYLADDDQPSSVTTEFDETSPGIDAYNSVAERCNPISSLLLSSNVKVIANLKSFGLLPSSGQS